MLKVIQPVGFDADAPKRAQRLREAVALHEIEGNPLTRDEVAMFEMFEREGWTDEQVRAHIIQLHSQPA